MTKSIDSSKIKTRKKFYVKWITTKNTHACPHDQVTQSYNFHSMWALYYIQSPKPSFLSLESITAHTFFCTEKKMKLISTYNKTIVVAHLVSHLFT